MTYDIAVIGLGPAGSTFCSCIDKHFSVIAIDKKNNSEGSFKKPCGGLLAPDAQKILAHMQLNLPKDILVDPQIFSVRTICLDSDITRHYRRMYVNVDRHKFDMWLIDNIPSNVTVKQSSTVTNIIFDGEIYRITYQSGGQESTVKAKMLIGADGAKSAVRHLLYPGLKLRSYIAIQQWFEENNPKPFYSCVFDSKNTDCCSWSISKDGKFIFGGAYPVDNSRQRFENQKTLLRDHGFVFSEPLKTEACIVLRPKTPFDIVAGKNNAFLIGEAAGLISPSSLEGMSYAMQSAYYLSQALNKSEKNAADIYARMLSKLKFKVFTKLAKCPFMYNKHLRAAVMKSGLQSIKMYKK
jgi:flavin-dependent dehydrogenase